MRRQCARALVAWSLVAVLPAVALAGPQLLCFPMVIDGARSLPWGGGGWNSPQAGYDMARLSADTAALLGAEVPVIVRMETLRRAAIYASRDSQAASRLFDTLRARAAAPAASTNAALAQFDLGYAVEAFRQTGHASPRPAWSGPTDDGYALIERALAARGADPAMEYAAALVASVRSFRGAAEEHLRRASANAPAGSMLARTLSAHEPLWGERLATSARATGR